MVEQWNPAEPARLVQGLRRWLPGILMVMVLGLSGCASNQGIEQRDQVAYAPVPAQSSPAGERTQRLWSVYERYEGTPYRYGGTTAAGFDCSGFIRTAFSEALDRQLPRTTGQMLASGTIVPRNQVQPGDLVFFRIAGKDQHAGIYMGDGRFIHASTSAGVMASSLHSHYWRDRYSRARRFDW